MEPEVWLAHGLSHLAWAKRKKAACWWWLLLIMLVMLAKRTMVVADSWDSLGRLLIGCPLCGLLVGFDFVMMEPWLLCAVGCLCLMFLVVINWA